MGGKLVEGVVSHDSDGSGKEVATKQFNREVVLGDIMWVKLHGDSWWPAQVVDENTVSQSSKLSNRAAGALVRLYGTYEYLYADPIKCHSEFEMVLEQNNGCHREIFEKALEQECPHMKAGRSKGKGSKTTGKVVKRNSCRFEKDKKVRIPKWNEVLKKHKLDSPHSGTNLLRKLHDRSARRLRVMQSLGLIAPSGSPFSKNREISAGL